MRRFGSVGSVDYIYMYAHACVSSMHVATLQYSHVVNLVSTLIHT